MAAATDAAADSWRAGVWQDGDDGSLAAFAPTRLPPPPRRPRPAPPRRVEQPAPLPAAPPPAAPRPAPRLADLFAEEERDAAVAAPSVPPPPVLPNEPVPVRVRFAGAERDEEVVLPLDAAPVWLGITRGVAAVLAAGCLADAFGGLDCPFVPEFSPLPGTLPATAAAFCGAGLAVFAARGCLPAVPRLAATLAAGTLAAAAAFAAATGAGLAPSALWQTAAAAATVAAAVRLAPPAAARGGWPGGFAAAAGALSCGLAFPLAGGALAGLEPEERTPAAVAVAVGGWWAGGDR